MAKIEIEKMCSCAKKDIEFQKKWLQKEFSSMEEAKIEALKAANHANANWCKKHRFFAYEEDGAIKIAVELSCAKDM
jgi:hypothetical protein